MAVKRALLVFAWTLAGCKASVDVTAGRAYQCSAEGVNDCPQGWRCGDDLRCLDPDSGDPRFCLSAQGCGGSWRCGLDQRCFDPGVERSRQCTTADLHCPTGWRCGFDQQCFSASSGGPLDGGARRQCASSDQCPTGWRCGRPEPTTLRFCQQTSVPGDYACLADDDCDGFRCNPVSQRCVDVRERVPNAPFSGFSAVKRGPLLYSSGATVQRLTVSDEAVARVGPFAPQAVRTFGLVSTEGLMVVTKGRDPFNFNDGGTGPQLLFNRLGVRDVRDFAAAPGGLWVARSDGGLIEYLASGTERQVTPPFPVDRLVIAVDNPVRVLALGISSAGLKSLDVTAVDFADAGPAVVLLAPDAGIATVLDVIATEKTAYLLTPDRLVSADVLGAQTVASGLDAGPGARLIVAGRREVITDQDPALFIVLHGGDAGLISTLVLDPPRSPTTVPTVFRRTPACRPCPGGTAAFEVVPLTLDSSNSGPSFLVRCPAAQTPQGQVPAASWEASPRQGCDLAYRRIATDDEVQATLDAPIAQTAAPHRRGLASTTGIWASEVQAGSGPTLKPFMLDRAALGAVRPSFFNFMLVLAGNETYAETPLGLTRFRVPQELTPVGSVTYKPEWVVTSAGVYRTDLREVGSDPIPRTFALAPERRPFVAPARAVTEQGYLFVASEDTVSLAQIGSKPGESFEPPVRLVPAIVPTPGLPIRSIASTPVDGGVPELWLVTANGVFNSTSVDGRRWVTRAVPLGRYEGLVIDTWSTGTGAPRLITARGEVLSMPTAVPLSEPIDSRGTRIQSVARACGVTWAVVSLDGGAGDRGTEGITLLGTQRSDAGLAQWRQPDGTADQLRGVDFRTATLLTTPKELLISSNRGAVFELRPDGLDGGCAEETR